jgi:hypothetical protein
MSCSVNDSAWLASSLRSAAICAHSSDPMAMGRSAAAHDALRTYTETIVTFLNDAKTAGNGLNTALKK